MLFPCIFHFGMISLQSEDVSPQVAFFLICQVSTGCREYQDIYGVIVLSGARPGDTYTGSAMWAGDLHGDCVWISYKVSQIFTTGCTPRSPLLSWLRASCPARGMDRAISQGLPLLASGPSATQSVNDTWVSSLSIHTAVMKKLFVVIFIFTYFSSYPHTVSPRRKRQLCSWARHARWISYSAKLNFNRKNGVRFQGPSDVLIYLT